jgi:hypothetical protein
MQSNSLLSIAGCVAGPPAIIENVRLFEVAAEDRYQTAAGLEADLRTCLSALEETGRIEPFPLASPEHSSVARLEASDSSRYGRKVCRPLPRE